MPIYAYQCEVCKGTQDRILPIGSNAPLCCGVEMSRQPTYPAMVKVIGEGGYPSRRKFLKGSAPGTTRNIHPWMTYNPADTSFDQLGQKKKAQDE